MVIPYLKKYIFYHQRNLDKFYFQLILISWWHLELLLYSLSCLSLIVVDTLNNLHSWFLCRTICVEMPFTRFFSLFKYFKEYIFYFNPINSKAGSPFSSSLKFSITFLLSSEYRRWINDNQTNQRGMRIILYIQILHYALKYG